MPISYKKSNIGELVRRLETNFISGGGTRTSKYVTSDLYEDISKIYAYLESKFTSGDKDDDPFFNICIAARNIWYRATDLDRKNIKVKPTKSEDDISAFMATVKLQDWMKKENFGQFLNNWGLDLAGFNSSVVKFVESGGELHSMVVPWSKLIVDQVNFDANPKIELLELTEAELYNHPGYDKEMVERLCDAKTARQTTDRINKDNKNDYIKLYEVHGMLPLSYLTGKDKDEDTYVQQMHVISFVEGKGNGEFDDYTLVSGREEKDPYMLTSLIPASDGSISLLGSVKNLFDAQWMQNHTVKAIKDQLDLASKLIFQTSDGNFVGQNALNAIQNGDILIHATNQPLTQLQNNSHDTVALSNFGTMWKGLSNEINGISEAMLGINPPSGSAWRQTEALLNESHSLFELMTENKGLAIERMLREYVIPFIIRRELNNADEISAVLESYDLNKIDSKYVKNQSISTTNQIIKDKILNNETVTPKEQDLLTAKTADELKAKLAEQGNQRFFKPDEVNWKKEFEGLEWKVEVDITGEAQDTQAVMTTLNTALQVMINPAFANNPKAQFVVDKILAQTGVISPVELSSIPSPQPVADPMMGGPTATPLPVNPQING